MKKLNFIFVGALLLSTFSCSSKSESKKDLSQSDKELESEIHSHDLDSEKIVLNKGEKWEVEVKMMKIIRGIESDAVNFKGKSLSEYTILADSLDSKLNNLTSNCTMTGQAHDELHKWLVPFMEKVDSFASIKSVESGKQFVKTIIQDFKLFNTFFK